MGRDLHCFQFEATTNKAAINIFMRDFSEHMHSSLLSIYLGIELLCHMVDMFHFSRYCQTVFQTGCNNLLSKQQGIRISVALHSPPPHNFFFFNFSH